MNTKTINAMNEFAAKKDFEILQLKKLLSDIRDDLKIRASMDVVDLSNGLWIKINDALDQS